VGAGRGHKRAIGRRRRTRATAELYVSARPADCWVTRGATSSAVSIREGGFSGRPSPEPCGKGSFSRVSSPLRSSFACPLRPPLSRPPVLPGFLPSSRHHRTVSTNAGIPGPATFRPQAFSASRRLSPPSGFTGLLHPAATSRVHCRTGDSLDPQRSPTRRRALPPCRYRLDAHRPKTGCHARTDRLRGVVPRIEAFLGVGV
jgi:hypothetical protein